MHQATWNGVRIVGNWLWGESQRGRYETLSIIEMFSHIYRMDLLVGKGGRHLSSVSCSLLVWRKLVWSSYLPKCPFRCSLKCYKCATGYNVPRWIIIYFVDKRLKHVMRLVSFLSISCHLPWAELTDSSRHACLYANIFGRNNFSRSKTKKMSSNFKCALTGNAQHENVFFILSPD